MFITETAPLGAVLSLCVFKKKLNKRLNSSTSARVRHGQKISAHAHLRPWAMYPNRNNLGYAVAAAKCSVICVVPIVSPLDRLSQIAWFHPYRTAMHLLKLSNSAEKNH